MKQLRYGRISWSYIEQECSDTPCTPLPLVEFSPVKINGKIVTPVLSDRIILEILKHRTANEKSFTELYQEFLLHGSTDRELSEGRSFLAWLKRENLCVNRKKGGMSLHPYFLSKDAPDHCPGDEFAKGLSFAIRPVEVNQRRVKLYLSDDAVMGLLSLPYGDDVDFLELVKAYIEKRFAWEEWQAPAPCFLDWVTTLAKRPVFRQGQLGLSLL